MYLKLLLLLKYIFCCVSVLFWYTTEKSGVGKMYLHLFTYSKNGDIVKLLQIKIVCFNIF